jgi:hypothetical protein
MGLLKFEPDQHKYFVDGIPIPSVTQILLDMGFIHPEFFTEGAAERGTLVHETTAGIELGYIDEFPEEISDYQLSYSRFIYDTKEFTNIEKQMYNPEMWYAGTIDRIVNTREEIIDIKTGDSIRWHRLQLAGYACMFDDPEQIIRKCAHIRREGEYVMKVHDDPKDIQVWKNLVALYDWKHPRRKRGPAF